jgi:UDP-N-acetylmuramate dehydrogenase
VSARRPPKSSEAIERAAVLLGDTVKRDRPIGELTTYRVGGAAALYLEPSGVAEIARLGEVIGATGIEVLVLGKGSNLLVADAGFSGLCVRLGDGFASIEIDAGLVRAGGAVPYPVLARRSAAAGLSGLEWAVGIPGSVGGGVAMNAGGHGAETSDRLVSCRVISLKGGHEQLVLAKSLELSYRHSSIGRFEVVTEATYQLEKGDASASGERIAEIVRWRREHQPGGQNAGSVFTNPPGDSAGRLVELAGLKGLRVGSAEVSDKHANFIQADPGGLADDVRRLIDTVRALVAQRLGVELRTELRLIGFEEGT